MLDFTKTQFSRGSRKPGVNSHQISFRAEIHIGVELFVSEIELARDKQDVLKKQVCKHLLDSLYYHVYGDLHPILAEMHGIAYRSIPPDQIHNFNRFKELDDKLKVLLKRP